MIRSFSFSSSSSNRFSPYSSASSTASTSTDVFSSPSFLREIDGVLRLNAAVQSLFSRLPSNATGFCSFASFSSIVVRISRSCCFRFSVPFRDSFYASARPSARTIDGFFFSAAFFSGFSTRDWMPSRSLFSSMWYTPAARSHSFAVFPGTRRLTWIQKSGLLGASRTASTAWRRSFTSFSFHYRSESLLNRTSTKTGSGALGFSTGGVLVFGFLT